jgi:molybdopterin-guanine dinucleotide biosynthesis protein B
VSEHHSIPVLGFVAFSGTGKTTLLQRLIPLLRDRGLRCAVIKHSHHDFEIDMPGKDSYRLRKAGAAQVLLASPFRTFWVEEGDGHSEPELAALIARLDLDRLDLVLVEGFREVAIAKIEVHRPALATPLLCLDDPRVVAVAADAQPPQALPVPCLPLNDPAAVAEFVVAWMQGCWPAD